jgi:hypothetical protein
VNFAIKERLRSDVALVDLVKKPLSLYSKLMGSTISSSWIFSAILMMLLFTVIILALLWVIRTKVSHTTLRQHHDVAGYIFSIIGVLYSVILGFTVINVQERYNKAAETVHTEATILADLYRDAIYFDEASLVSIRSNLKKYVEYVIEQEWAHPSDETRRFKANTILQNLWTSYQFVDLQSERAKIWYQQTIAKLDQLMNARLSREFYSWDSLSPMMWTILVLGALITIGFTFFFGLENLRTQMLMTSLLTIYLTFMLYLVFSLDHVFEGSVHVTPKAFQENLSIFNRLD